MGRGDQKFVFAVNSGKRRLLCLKGVVVLTLLWTPLCCRIKTPAVALCWAGATVKESMNLICSVPCMSLSMFM
jgi:hypothetical protein